MLKALTGPQVKDGLSAAYYERLASGQGRAILAAADRAEKSYILPGADNSLFTHHLLAGLRGDIASEDGLIRLFDLFEYVQPKVTADHPAQHPVFKADLRDNFPVALRLAGQPKLPAKGSDGFVYDAYLSFCGPGAGRCLGLDKTDPCFGASWAAGCHLWGGAKARRGSGDRNGTRDPCGQTNRGRAFTHLSGRLYGRI